MRRPDVTREQAEAWVRDTPPEVRAAEIAAELYDGHPAAAALMVEAWTRGNLWERKERSRVALAALDPELSIGVVLAMGAWAAARTEQEIPVPAAKGPLAGAARAIADLVTYIASEAPAADRRRIGWLLSAVCREAALVAKRRKVAA
jgi:hypothetical protein